MVVVIPKVFTERQKQRCDNSAIMLTILFLLKTMDSLKNGLQPTRSRSRSVDADT